AHSVVCGDGAGDRDSGADCRRPRLHSRRVLLPRVAGGVCRQRPVAAGRSDAEPVSRRHNAPAPCAWRPRQADGDSAADGAPEDRRARRRSGAELDADPRRPGGARPRRARDSDSAARVHLLRLLAMIAIHDLVKQYGRFTAVDCVSLDVKPGEIHGFLGPNGAGKTTTLRMIAGLLKPSAGRIEVNGHDVATAPEAAKASLGFIPRSEEHTSELQSLAY